MSASENRFHNAYQEETKGARLQPAPLDSPDIRRFAWVRVDSLVIDGRAQRGLNQQRIAAMKEHFNWQLFEVPTVTYRDGVLCVVEGQHRTVTYREKWPGSWILVAIIETTDKADEARAALEINNGHRKMTPLEVWHQKVRGGDEHEIQAEIVLHNMNLYLAPAAGRNAIAAVNSISRIIHGQPTIFGAAERLRRVLRIIETAYPSDDDESAPMRWNYRIIDGVSAILKRNTRLDDGRLAKAIRRRIAVQWLSEVPRGSTGGRAKDGLAMAFLDSYNRGLIQEKRLTWN